MFNTRTPRPSARTAAVGAALMVPALGSGLFAAAAPVAAAAPPAGSTVVQSLEERGGLSVRAANGKANNIAVALTNTTFTVRDTGAAVFPGEGCTAVNANTVRCDAFGEPVRIDTGDLADVVIAPLPLPTTVQAGAGDDIVTTGSAADDLRGAIGNDKLTAGAGRDQLDGNVGVDVLSAGSGRDTMQGGGREDEADVFNGGDGTDIVDYSGRDIALNITLDGTANDGEPGEGDNVRTDVEEIEGGEGGDRLTGSNIATVTNRLLGREGGDTLVGLAGRDLMFSHEGNDTLDGGAGNDDMDGGPNADSMAGGADRDEVLYTSRTANVAVDLDDVADDGEAFESDNVRSDVEDISTGSGFDRLTGSSAANRLSGGAGPDNLDGGVGPDLFSGGSGFDRVSYQTRTDTVIANIDGKDNDGVGEEKDNITLDVEAIIGGQDDDFIGGSDFGDDSLFGLGGDDILLGFGGNDSLFGDEGSDGLNCGPGVGELANGGADNDRSIGCETNVGVETINP